MEDWKTKLVNATGVTQNLIGYMPMSFLATQVNRDNIIIMYQGNLVYIFSAFCWTSN